MRTARIMGKNQLFRKLVFNHSDHAFPNKPRNDRLEKK